MLFPSPRYGTQALVKLIESVDAKVMLIPEFKVPVVDEVLERKQMKALGIPTVEWLLSKVTERYPYTKGFEECKHEPFICLREYSPIFALLHISNMVHQIHLALPDSPSPLSGHMNGQIARCRPYILIHHQATKSKSSHSTGCVIPRK